MRPEMQQSQPRVGKQTFLNKFGSFKKENSNYEISDKNFLLNVAVKPLDEARDATVTT